MDSIVRLENLAIRPMESIMFMNPSCPITKVSCSEVTNAGMHYAIYPIEIADFILERYDGDTYMVWSYLLGQSSTFKIIKAVICKRLSIGQKRFQRAMANLAEIQLAWLAPGQRLADGSLKGKSWHVSGMPPNVENILRNYLGSGATANAKCDQSVAPSANAKCDQSVAPSANAKCDQSVAPSVNAVTTGDTGQRTVSANSRQSGSCPELTTTELKQTTNELQITTENNNAQSKSARSRHVIAEFHRFYRIYPRKRDKGRALNVWKKITQRLNVEQITELANTCIDNVNRRIKAGEWLELDYVPYAKSYLNGQCWEDLPEGEWSTARLGLATRQTVDEMFAPEDSGNGDGLPFLEGDFTQEGAPPALHN